MSEQIKKLAEKFEKETIVEQYNKFLAEQQLKIGFVGMFSAGKTSLINSLLGTKLPVSPAPTTKSICVIESSSDRHEFGYYIEAGNQRLETDFMDFQDLLNGRKTGTAVLQLPTRPGIPEGVIYVDTPGVDNFSADESDLTYRYLALLDAAVVCIDINDGTIRQHLLDFISEPALFALSSRMIFVLTHADVKTPDGADAVKNDVIQKLRNFSTKKSFDTSSIEERVIAINANDCNAAMQVVEKINSCILSQRNAIRQQRLKIQFADLAKQLVALLQDDVDNLKCDTSILDKKKRQVNDAIRQIEEEIAKRSDRLETMTDKLAEQVKSILLGHELEISNAGSDENMKTAMLRVNAEIADAVDSLVKSFCGNFSVSGIDNLLGADLLMKLKRIDNTRDLSVQVGTAALVAWLCPASGIANAAEAAGGAAAQTAGKAANKAAAAGKAAGKAAGNSTFKSVLGTIGKIIHDINPLEMIGDWVAIELKHNTYTSMVNVKSVQIANNVLEMLEEPFESEILTPLRNHYNEQKKSLEKLIKDKKDGISDFTAKRAELLDAIDELNCLE